MKYFSKNLDFFNFRNLYVIERKAERIIRRKGVRRIIIENA